MYKLFFAYKYIVLLFFYKTPNQSTRLPRSIKPYCCSVSLCINAAALCHFCANMMLFVGSWYHIGLSQKGLLSYVRYSSRLQYKHFYDLNFIIQ
uniref:Uncharacterized protein n=1 Tax=Oryza brachyantha TaxID=4533 RepID=J3LWP9_ORYBR